MQRELKDSRTPTTAGNIKENVDTLYNGRNTAGKQPEPLWLSSDQSEDQAPDTTLRSSPEPEMQEEYTNTSNQRPNRNPAGEPPAHNRHNSDARTAHEPRKREKKTNGAVGLFKYQKSRQGAN